MTRILFVRCAAPCALVAAAAAVTIAAPQAIARADSCSDVATGVPLATDSGPCAYVLAQERRWLTAITSGDRDTVDSILEPNFRHINSDGQLLDRAQEIDGIDPVTFTMNPSEQLVDLAGDTAVIHGVNTLMEGGNVLARERFTDVFVLRNDTWMALSAQETALG